MRIIKRDFSIPENNHFCFEWRFFLDDNYSLFPDFCLSNRNGNIRCGIPNSYELSPDDLVDLIWDHLSDCDKEYLMLNGFNLVEFLVSRH